MRIKETAKAALLDYKLVALGHHTMSVVNEDWRDITNQVGVHGSGSEPC